MTDINRLKEEELRQLNDEEVFDLETLITDGKDARFPVKFKFPKQQEDGTYKLVNAKALLRPLTNIEWNNASRFKRSPNDKTTNEVELLKKALYTTEGKQMPPELVEAIPNGVVLTLVTKVAEISGVDVDENMKLAKEMMGFSV